MALGLTLIYGVLHIINFAHGALLTAALYAAFFAHRLLGLDPYLAAFALTPAFFAIGYALQRFVIGPASRGDDRNILLVTLGLAVVIENGAALPFRADTRTINLPYAFEVDRSRHRLPVACRASSASSSCSSPRSCSGCCCTATDLGKAMRAVARRSDWAPSSPASTSPTSTP